MGKLARWLTSYVHPWWRYREPEEKKKKKKKERFPTHGCLFSFIAFRFLFFFLLVFRFRLLVIFLLPLFPARPSAEFLYFPTDVSAFIVITEYAGNLSLDQCCSANAFSRFERLIVRTVHGVCGICDTVNPEL